MRPHLERAHRWLERHQDSHRSRHPAFRIFMAAVGSALIPLGVILIPLPGPGFGTIGVGLAILSLEFHWPRRMLASLMDSRLMGAPGKPSAPALTAGTERESGPNPR